MSNSKPIGSSDGSPLAPADRQREDDSGPAKGTESRPRDVILLDSIPVGPGQVVDIYVPRDRGQPVGAVAGGEADVSGSALPLQGSVGIDAANDDRDIKQVSDAVTRLGLPVASHAAGDVAEAIRAYQREHRIDELEGRLEPGGPTHTHLMRALAQQSLRAMSSGHRDPSDVPTRLRIEPQRAGEKTIDSREQMTDLFVSQDTSREPGE